MADADPVRAAFPELDRIDDQRVRRNVVAAWTTAMADNDVTDLTGVPWFPPVQDKHGIEDESLVAHVRHVTRGAITLAEVLGDRPEPAIDMDVVVAGALVHDISKLYEFDNGEPTDVYRYVDHPNYGVHIAAEAGLPPAVQHIIISHSERTGVEPATLEAVIVHCADVAAAAAIKMRAVDDLRDV